MIFFFENSNAFFGKFTFCAFHIFLCPAHKMNFFEKKFQIHFLVEKFLNFRTITCVDQQKNEKALEDVEIC